MRKILTVCLIISFLLNTVIASTLFVFSLNTTIINKTTTQIAQHKHVDLNELEFGAPKRVKWNFIIKDLFKVGYKTASIFAFLSLLFLFLLDTMIEEYRTNSRLRREIVFTKILTVENGVLLLAALALFVIKLQSPLAPVYYSDGYSGMVFHFLNGDGLTHNNGRNFIYPSFVLLSTLLFHDLKGVVIIQHLLGSLAGIFIYKSFGVIAEHYQEKKNVYYTIKATGAVAFALYALSNVPFFWEKWFMREGVSAFIHALFLYLLFVFFARMIRRESLMKMGSGLLILNYFIFAYQPRWGFALIFTNILVMAAIIILPKKAGLKKRMLYAVAIPMAICIIFIALPEKLLSYNDVHKKWFGPLNFLFSHMKMISIEMEKDLANPHFDRYDKEILQNLVDAYKQAKTDNPKYHALGYHFNHLFWGKARNDLIDSFHGDFGKLKRFAYYYYLRALIHEPVEMCSKIIHVLHDYYAITANRIQYKSDLDYNSMYKHDNSWEKAYQSSTSPVIKKYYQDIEKLSGEKNTFIPLPGGKWLFMLLNLLFYPLLVLMLVTFGHDLITHNKHFMLWHSIFFSLFTIVFCINLTSAVSYILIRRYINEIFVLSLELLIIPLGYIAHRYLYVREKLHLKALQGRKLYEEDTCPSVHSDNRS